MTRKWLANGPITMMTHWVVSSRYIFVWQMTTHFVYELSSVKIPYMGWIFFIEYDECVCLDIIKDKSSWASYQIRKIAGCACAGNAGNVFPRRRFQRKPLVSDPGMHHGTCVTHVPWCMSGSRTRGGGENVPGIPGACAPAISRIWQEAHWLRPWFGTFRATQCIMTNYDII